MQEREPLTITIVGAGLVGTLAACVFADKGYNVKLCEKRSDIRTTSLLKGKSINLALSERGLLALDLIKARDEILKHATPMYGRCLHLLNGKRKCMQYDPVKNQCIYSISRNLLNSLLLNKAEDRSRVSLYFNLKLQNVDFDKGFVKLLKLTTNEEVNFTTDYIIGADGAFSTVRKCMQCHPLFSFEQSYIDHGYVELNIKSDIGRKYMTPNHLHIWPRRSFMLIALPNLDYSWTATLFMSFDKFKEISSNEDLVRFFTTAFPDIMDMIGPDALITDFFKTKPNTLMSINCQRFNYEKCLLIGDAAHAIVPFYGQGMNAGFEDCRILNRILVNAGDDLQFAFKRFSDERVVDAHAISKLAIYNYREMRDLVVDPKYLIRKRLDNFLYWLFKDKWLPLYVCVTFGKMPYNECVQNRAKQNKILKGIACNFILLVFLIVFYFIDLVKIN